MLAALQRTTSAAVSKRGRPLIQRNIASKKPNISPKIASVKESDDESSTAGGGSPASSLKRKHTERTRMDQLAAAIEEAFAKEVAEAAALHDDRGYLGKAMLLLLPSRSNGPDSHAAEH